MIAIVDTGGANLSSVSYALQRMGRQSEITTSPTRIREASHVILPGVGAAADSMERIRRAGLLPCLRELKQPVLGICLGMQLLFESSAEGEVDCLGILPGKVTRLPREKDLSVPHMGWNQVRTTGDGARLLTGVSTHSCFYFVHSYVAPMGPWVLATFDYGGQYPAMIGRGNYFGAQFHPERSASAGARLLGNFLSI